MKEKLNSLPKFVRILALSILGGICLCCFCLIVILAIPSDTSPRIDKTGTNIPVEKITLTSTLRPSDTPLPSLTPTLTLTLTPSNTPTETPTIPPATLTAEARNATTTQKAFFTTSTAQAINSARTATSQSRSATATEIASYTEIYWKDLITYPNNYIGQKVKINGQVFNINGDQELQMWVGNYEAIYVVMKDPFSDLYKDSWISVYGTVAGENCGTNALGGSVCQPLLINAFYIKR